MWFIATIESTDFCGISDSFKVWADFASEAEDIAYHHADGIVLDYLTEEDLEETGGEVNTTVSVEEYNQSVHGEIDHYSELSI